MTVPQVDQDARVITVDRKVIEVAGYLYIEAPKNRKRRKTIYPRRTPGGYPLADRLAGRIEEARAEQAAGTNPLGLIFPSPTGKHWRSSNFNRNVLERAYLTVGWRDADGSGAWTWHSLRHVFCTTALFTWKLDPTDVSRMAGHARDCRGQPRHGPGNSCPCGGGELVAGALAEEYVSIHGRGCLIDGISQR